MGQIAQQLLALNSAKHAIREAINDKGGGPLDKAAPLSSYPDAIAAIPTGGGVKAVVFFDYDGTIVTSYSVEEFLALDAMPENPTHDGLTALGWNWLIEDAKEYVQKYGSLHIGQMYTTPDGSTRITVVCTDLGANNVYITIQNASALINWGDGTSVTGTGVYSHVYNAPGVYVITLEIVQGVTGSPSFFFDSAVTTVKVVEINVGKIAIQYLDGIGTVKYVSISAYGWSDNTASFRDCRNLRALVLPRKTGEQGARQILNYAFQNCNYLDVVSIPKQVTSVRQGAFQYTYMLKKVHFADGVVIGIGGQNSSIFSSSNVERIYGNVKTLSESPFATAKNLKETILCKDAYDAIITRAYSSCNSLEKAVVVDSVITVSTYAFQNCSMLKDVELPEGLNTIANQAFYGCTMLKEIDLPSTITAIGAGVFNNCYMLEKIVIRAITPPSLSNVNSFNNGPRVRSFYVPDDSVGAYKAATNWSSFEDRIFPISALTE